MPVDLQAATQRARARLGSFVRDKWRLDHLIGVGGMACVYAATHRNNKRAALKMLHPEYSDDATVRERFLREGYLANSVGHRGVVVVDDDDVTEDGAVFLVMELLDGETLAERVRRKGRLPIEEVLAVADQVLDALAAAHAGGIVHRDLKPENLFLTRDGAVKLLDFGVGRLGELEAGVTNTLSGQTMGTPAFMAPEQARGRWGEVDARTDLWALGATLFTLLTGEYVHEADTVNETLALAAIKSARPIGLLRPDLPARAAALVDRALAYARSDRFPDARSMQAETRAIYAALSGQDVAALSRVPVPDTGLPYSTIAAPPAPDPRLRATTARAFAASRLPEPLRAAWSSPARRPVLVASVGLAIVLGGLLWQSSADVSGVPAASVGAVSLPKAASHPPPALHEPSAVPQVSIEDLPRESRKKASGPKDASPQKVSDPFARRR